jgi:hypothetical protein
MKPNNPRKDKTMKEQWFDGTLYEEAKAVASVVGFKIEDVQRDKAEGCGYLDGRLVPENRQSFCYWLLNFIWVKVEEWHQQSWTDYPLTVIDWYENASRLEAEATEARRLSANDSWPTALNVTTWRPLSLVSQ